MTHTEYVHILFGVGLILGGASWLGAQRVPASPLRFVWPLLVFLVGLFLVIPTETQERTYTRVGLWDTFLSVFPDSLDVWLATVRKGHVLQHKAAGVCAMLAGGIEGLRGAGRLQGAHWRWAMPLLAVGAGLAIGIHGGTHTHLPRVAEQAHHWVLGGALVLGGLAHALATVGRPPRPVLQQVLPVLMIVAGLDLALLYRLR